MESKLLEAAITGTPAHITFKSSRPTLHFSSKATFKSPESNFVANGCRPIQASFSSTTSSSSLPIRLVKKRRVDQSETLTLPFVRHSLIRQEDSIIFSLLERAQYCYNADTYDHDAFSVDSFNGSLVKFMVRETEKLHVQVGRYKNPDEVPFFPADLPEPMLPPLQYPQLRNGTRKSKAVKKHKSNRYHTALGSNKAHSQELKQRQLKRDTSSAKTENITFGKSSSQSNLNEVAEQPIV